MYTSPAYAGPKGPSYKAIFAWAGERYAHNWPVLLVLVALGYVPKLLDALVGRGVPSVHVVLAVLILLGTMTATASCAWIITRPEPQTLGAALIFVGRNLPRLIAMQVIVSAAAVAPGAALVYLFGKHTSGIVGFIVALIMIPVTFALQLAFVSAAVEGGWPWSAIGRTIRRLSDEDGFFTIGGALTVAIIAGIPALILLVVANAMFPPERIPLPFPPGFSMPTLPPGISMPTRSGPFGSGIPSQAAMWFGIIMLPITAYVTAWVTGANQELRRRSGEVVDE